jgi:hypothetical protein
VKLITMPSTNAFLSVCTKKGRRATRLK